MTTPAHKTGRTAHTPGPWTVGDTNSRMILCDVPGMCDGHDGYSVAVTTAHSLLPEQEAIANARLIAAAPALLEALERLLRFIDDASEYELQHAADYSVYLNARAALSATRSTGD